MLLSLSVTLFTLLAFSQVVYCAPRAHAANFVPRQEEATHSPNQATSYVYVTPSSNINTSLSNRPSIATSTEASNSTIGILPVVTAYVYATPTNTNSTTGSTDILTSSSAALSSGFAQVLSSSNLDIRSSQVERVSATSSLATDASTPTSSISASNLSNPIQTGSVVSSDTGVVQEQSSRPLMMTYYVEWAGAQFPPEKVDFGRFDWIDFAFGVPNSTFDITWDGPDHAADLLTRLVAAAHAVGTKIKLSIGGWTGSKYFSTAVSSSKNRKTFADKILTVYNQFSLDGIDVDWEYPGQSGYHGNHVSRNDTANLLLFLRQLRTTLPASAKISATGQTVPFADANGDPIADALPFAAVLDWVLIMNYDTWGASKPPGPNAPLGNACGHSSMPNSSAFAGLAAWTAAGFPASQLVLGVPSYGYISVSTAGSLRTRSQASTSFWRSDLSAAHAFRRSPIFDFDRYTLATGLDGAGNYNFEVKAKPETIHSGDDQGDQGKNSDEIGDDGSEDSNADDEDGSDGIAVNSEGDGSSAEQDQDPDSLGFDAQPPTVESAPQHSPPIASADDSGQIQFRDLVYQGVLQYKPLGQTPSAPSGVLIGSNEVNNDYEGWSGFERHWDNCSNTPFLRSPAAEQVIPYDDAVSLVLKAAFVQQAGMLGVNMFDVHGDTDQWDLTDALRQGLGLS